MTGKLKEAAAVARSSGESGDSGFHWERQGDMK